jgi:hypothetical protein
MSSEKTEKDASVRLGQEENEMEIGNRHFQLRNKVIAPRDLSHFERVRPNKKPACEATNQTAKNAALCDDISADRKQRQADVVSRQQILARNTLEMCF